MTTSGAAAPTVVHLDERGAISSWSDAAARLFERTAPHTDRIPFPHLFTQPAAVRAVLRAARQAGRGAAHVHVLRPGRLSLPVILALRPHAGGLEARIIPTGDVRHDGDAIDAWLDELAHEIATPLTQVSNSLFLQRRHLDRGGARTTDEQLLARLSEATDAALDGVHRLGQVVRDLRRARKPRAASVEILPQASPGDGQGEALRQRP